jgi:1-acyl-sn-glycerol-3-phosphate acyltransferase
MLTREMSQKAVYCMMEEKQLKEYRFFSRLGAFSVDLSSPIRAGASIRYALRLLRKNDSALWIFPQGKICPAQAPIEVRPGTDYMAKHAPHALLVPVAFRYEFFREDRPNCLVWVGDPFPSVNCTNQRIQETCQESFAAVNKAAETQDLTGFKLLFTPRLPVNKQWQWFRFALTGRLREFKATN